jgi:hypothetical protein
MFYREKQKSRSPQQRTAFLVQNTEGGKTIKNEK